MATTPILDVSHVTKRFANVTALEDVSFQLEAGQVLALLGENGAGKSTLVNILCGLFQPDAGELRIGGNPVRLASPQDAYRLGIAVIHQELSLARDLNVAENIFLGEKPMKRSLGFLKTIDFDTMNRDSEALLRRFGARISPTAMISDLTPTEQQLLEILKGIRRQSRIFLMDEPTAGLDDAEVGSLLELVRHLKQQGVAIIYVSHILEEVQKIADEIMVLRDGRKVDKIKAAAVPMKKVISMMIGHEVADAPIETERRAFGPPVLEAKDIYTNDNYVNGVSFELRKGEILGFTGLTSSGRSELLRALYGVGSLARGQIVVDGEVRQIKNAKQASDLGLGMIPRERKEEGIFGIRSIKENITVSSLKRVSNAFGVTNRSRELEVAGDVVDKLRVSNRDPNFPIAFLSGGNQQKVVFGRWLAARPKVLLCDEPTRGVDIGAKAEIAQIIRALAGEGISTIISSSEIPELIALCDRVLVLYKGRLVGTLVRGSFGKEQLMNYVIGGGQAVATDAGGHVSR